MTTSTAQQDAYVQYLAGIGAAIDTALGIPPERTPTEIAESLIESAIDLADRGHGKIGDYFADRVESDLRCAESLLTSIGEKLNAAKAALARSR